MSFVVVVVAASIPSLVCKDTVYWCCLTDGLLMRSLVVLVVVEVAAAFSSKKVPAQKQHPDCVCVWLVGN